MARKKQLSRGDMAELALATLGQRFTAYAEYVHGLNAAPFQKEWAAAMANPAIPRLVIIAPPESGKTAWCIAYCAWLIGRDPSVHIGYVGNTAAQALRQSVAVRDTVRANPKFREIFPDVTLDEAKGTAEREWFVRRPDPGDKDATFIASGFRGPLLGARLDVVVLDDYSDQENTSTPEQQERAWEWLQQNVLTRLNPDKGRLICIQTRWAEGDVAGQLREVGARVLQYSALTEAGEPLWPERWRKAGLDKRRREIGSRHFDLHYMGVIVPRDGNVFKPQWWSYWDASGAMAPECHSEPQAKNLDPERGSGQMAWERDPSPSAQGDKIVAQGDSETRLRETSPSVPSAPPSPFVLSAEQSKDEQASADTNATPTQPIAPPPFALTLPPGAPKLRSRVLSLDTASKTGISNDYSAATIWALCDRPQGRADDILAPRIQSHYLLHAWRAKLEYPDLLRAVEGMARQWQADTILIEDKGAGQSLIQELRRRGTRVTAINPTADKLTRAISVTPTVEAGAVFLPRHAGWLEDLRYELETFPRSRHDDWVDSMVQYLEWATAQGGLDFRIWF